MIRVFGAAAYPNIIRLPYRLIVRAAEIEGQRDAGQRLNTLRDAAIGAGLKLGQKWVPGKKETPDPNAGHFDLTPLLEHQEQLDRLAAPWNHTPEAVERRKDAAQDAAFRQAFKSLQA